MDMIAIGNNKSYTSMLCTKKSDPCTTQAVLVTACVSPKTSPCVEHGLTKFFEIKMPQPPWLVYEALDLS